MAAANSGFQSKEETINILMRNLHNARATFGEDSSQFKSLQEMVESHIVAMAIANQMDLDASTSFPSGQAGSETRTGVDGVTAQLEKVSLEK